MMLRLFILVPFTTFLFGPIFGIFMSAFNLESDSEWFVNALGILTISSLIALLCACAGARSEHPELVRTTLIWVALLVGGFLIWALTLPAISA